MFAEYDYADLGSKTVPNTYTCTGSCGFNNPYPYAEKQVFQRVLFGLNYHFDMGNAAVAPRY